MNLYQTYLPTQDVRKRFVFSFSGGSAGPQETSRESQEIGPVAGGPVAGAQLGAQLAGNGPNSWGPR